MWTWAGREGVLAPAATYVRCSPVPEISSATHPVRRIMQASTRTQGAAGWLISAISITSRLNPRLCKSRRAYTVPKTVLDPISQTISSPVRPSQIIRQEWQILPGPYRETQKRRAAALDGRDPVAFSGHINTFLAAGDAEYNAGAPLLSPFDPVAHETLESE